MLHKLPKITDELQIKGVFPLFVGLILGKNGKTITDELQMK